MGSSLLCSALQTTSHFFKNCLTLRIDNFGHIHTIICFFCLNVYALPTVWPASHSVLSAISCVYMSTSPGEMCSWLLTLTPSPLRLSVSRRWGTSGHGSLSALPCANHNSSLPHRPMVAAWTGTLSYIHLNIVIQLSAAASIFRSQFSIFELDLWPKSQKEMPEAKGKKKSYIWKIHWKFNKMSFWFVNCILILDTGVLT